MKGLISKLKDNSGKIWMFWNWRDSNPLYSKPNNLTALKTKTKDELAIERYGTTYYNLCSRRQCVINDLYNTLIQGHENINF